jgi:RimJ/RimL family protein N-acetyltransferase
MTLHAVYGLSRDIPALESRRLVLRAPAFGDLDGFVRFFTSDRAKYAGGSADAAKAWSEFAEMIGHWVLRGFGSFIITRKDNGKAIGHAGGLQPPGWPERELGWSIWTDDDEGQGFAAEAVRTVRDHLFTTCGWTTAISYIAPDNLRSIAFAEHLGAVLDQGSERPENLRCLAYRHPAPQALA